MVIKVLSNLPRLLNTYIRLIIIKIFNFNRIYFSFPVILPFNSEIELGKESEVKISSNVRAKSGFKVKARKNSYISIGKNTFFNYNNLITSHEKIEIGDNCQFGPNVLIYDHDHDYKSKNGISGSNYLTAPVKIGSNVWIGANSVILRGTTLGNDCVVGAGTIVKGNYPDNTVIISKNNIVTTKY